MREKFVQVQGLKAAYLKYGQGAKPVFLLHGWGGSKESWNLLIENLLSENSQSEMRSNFCLIAVDFPGFGASEEPKVGWQVADYAQWFEEFVSVLYQSEKLAGDYDLIVHSFGGRVLLKLFAEDFQHIGKVKPDKLVLIAAAGIKPVLGWRLKIAAKAAFLGKVILSWPVLNKLAPLAQKILYKVLRTHDYEKTSGVMRETFLKVIKEDLTDCLEKVGRPALIIWGDRDSYVPVKNAYLMQEKITGSQLRIIKAGRHGIHKTHAGQVAEWISDFLR